MENYICIGNRKTALTDEQLKELGFPLPKAAGDYTLDEFIALLREGRAREVFKPRDVIKCHDYELELLDFDCEQLAENTARPHVTVMTKSIVGKRRMNDGACRGWVDTELRHWLNGEFFAQLPSELKAAIAPVTKLTYSSNGEELRTVDAVFLPSESELYGSAIYSAFEEGKRYAAFENSDARVRYDEDGDGCWYWSRSSAAGSAANFASVYNYGFPNSYGASNAGGVPACFTLA